MTIRKLWKSHGAWACRLHVEGCWSVVGRGAAPSVAVARALVLVAAASGGVG